MSYASFVQCFCWHKCIYLELEGKTRRKSCLCDTGIFCNKNQKMNRPKSILFLQKTWTKMLPHYWCKMPPNIANLSTFSTFRGPVGGVGTWNRAQMSAGMFSTHYVPGPGPAHDQTAPRSTKMKKNCFNYPSYLDSLFLILFYLLLFYKLKYYSCTR